MGFEPEVKSAFDELAQWHPSSFGKNAQFDVPRPGIEPGLEVPETSVMSFSLPGRQESNCRKQYISRAGRTR